VKSVALAVLQLLALATPPIAVLIKMLRNSDDLPWRYRKWSFGMAILSIVSFISAGIVTLAFLTLHYSVDPLLQVALGLAVSGLIPFALFAGVLYKEHRMTFGP
jgi:hypothetical protein